MSSATVYSAVHDYLAATWTGAPLVYENETFTLPAPVDYPAAPTQWVDVEFQGTGYSQESIGSGQPSLERWVEEGAVMFHCFTQLGAGSLSARSTASAMADLLRGLELPGTIRFRRMSIGDGGPGTDDGNWWALTLRAEFIRG